MTRSESDDKIEGIVGASRHPDRHIGRAVSSEQRVYILHSGRCFNRGGDLRLCPYSLALDAGIEPESWTEDVPVLLSIDCVGRLVGSVPYQTFPNADEEVPS